MLTAVGRHLIASTSQAGRSVLLFTEALLSLRMVGRSMKLVAKQIDSAGIGSILVLSLIAALTGAIMVMQMGPSLEQYGALRTVGGMIGVTFTRELGPIWAAVIILARVGSAMAAELGTMTVNEEVEALRVMSISPIRYLVMPRILALVLVMPFLTCLADVVGLAGGALVAHFTFAVPFDVFLQSAQDFISCEDLYGGLIKSAVFAMIIGTIACSQGLATEGGAEGVGKATTSTVRLCVIFTLLADLIMTQTLRLIMSCEFAPS